jgi:hypothetical protein
LPQQLGHASYDDDSGEEKRVTVAEDNSKQDAGSWSTLIDEMCPSNFHQTSSDDIMDKDHWVSCDATLEISHRVTSVISRDPSSEEVNKPLLGDGAYGDDKSAVQVHGPPAPVPVTSLHVPYRIPTKAAPPLDCSSEASDTESSDEAQQQKGNRQRQKRRIESVHQDNRQLMAPKHPSNTGWSHPFLEYDKSVVIKLLIVCLSECELC